MKIALDSHYAILASGVGSNALALLQTGKSLLHPAGLVIATNSNSPLEQYCKDHSVNFKYLRAANDKVDFEDCLLAELKKHRIDWIFLAGFMKILSAHFLKEFSIFAKGKIFNIHPSLLPLYPGLKGYEKSFRNKDEFYGHSIHLVEETVDAGEIVSQVKIKADHQIDLEKYIELGKKVENENYASVLKKLLLGRLNERCKVEIYE